VRWRSGTLGIGASLLSARSISHHVDGDVSAARLETLVPVSGIGRSDRTQRRSPRADIVVGVTEPCLAIRTRPIDVLAWAAVQFGSAAIVGFFRLSANFSRRLVDEELGRSSQCDI